MKKLEVKDIAFFAVITAVYAALTYATSFIAYGPFQFRVSEALVLLVFFNKKYFLPLTLGCLIANIFGPFGGIDVVFGTLATALALLSIVFISHIVKKKGSILNLFIASILPVVINAIIIGLVLTFVLDNSISNFFLYASQVLLGEFVCISIVGEMLFTILQKNEAVMEIIQ